MFFDIDPDNGIPIYDQVCRQLKFAIAQGLVKPGDRVPSVRELSRDLVINPNTIARSFQVLQQEAILESVRGIGFQVASGAVSECRRQRKDLILSRLSSVLGEAIQSGLTDEEIDKLFQQAKSSTKRRNAS